MHTLLRDISYGIRMLARTPGFTLVAVLSLALGIGVNTTVFSLLDAIRLRSLPIPNPDPPAARPRLVSAYATLPEGALL